MREGRNKKVRRSEGKKVSLKSLKQRASFDTLMTRRAGRNKKVRRLEDYRERGG